MTTMKPKQIQGIQIHAREGWKAHTSTRPNLTAADFKKWKYAIFKKLGGCNDVRQIDQFYYPHIRAAFEQIIGDDVLWTMKAQTAALDHIRYVTGQNVSKEYCEGFFDRHVDLEKMTKPQLVAIMRGLNIDAARNC